MSSKSNLSQSAQVPEKITIKNKQNNNQTNRVSIQINGDSSPQKLMKNQTSRGSISLDNDHDQMYRSNSTPNDKSPLINDFAAAGDQNLMDTSTIGPLSSNHNNNSSNNSNIFRSNSDKKTQNKLLVGKCPSTGQKYGRVRSWHSESISNSNSRTRSRSNTEEDPLHDVNANGVKIVKKKFRGRNKSSKVLEHDAVSIEFYFIYYSVLLFFIFLFKFSALSPFHLFDQVLLFSLYFHHHLS